MNECSGTFHARKHTIVINDVDSGVITTDPCEHDCRVGGGGLTDESLCVLHIDIIYDVGTDAEEEALSGSSISGSCQGRKAEGHIDSVEVLTHYMGWKENVSVKHNICKQATSVSM